MNSYERKSFSGLLSRSLLSDQKYLLLMMKDKTLCYSYCNYDDGYTVVIKGHGYDQQKRSGDI